MRSQMFDGCCAVETIAGMYDCADFNARMTQLLKPNHSVYTKAWICITSSGQDAAAKKLLATGWKHLQSFTGAHGTPRLTVWFYTDPKHELLPPEWVTNAVKPIAAAEGGQVKPGWQVKATGGVLAGGTAAAPIWGQHGKLFWTADGARKRANQLKQMHLDKPDKYPECKGAKVVEVMVRF